MTDIKPAYYTVMEVANILRIGRRKAYDLVASGDIPSIKIGDSIRIPRVPFEQQFGIVDDTRIAV